MIELSVIRDLVAIFGVIAGFTYYVMTVRNNQKNQDFANESRKAQLFMQLADKISTQENMDRSQELMEMNWTDFQDFQQKYDSNVNRDNATMRYSHWWQMETIGYLIHEDLIDPEMVYQLGGFQMLLHWYRFEPVIK